MGNSTLVGDRFYTQETGDVHICEGVYEPAYLYRRLGVPIAYNSVCWLSRSISNYQELLLMLDASGTCLGQTFSSGQFHLNRL